MAKLEDLRPLTTLLKASCRLNSSRSSLFSWTVANVLELTYKTPTGCLGKTLLSRDSEPNIEFVEAGRPWSFDGDGAAFRLASVHASFVWFGPLELLKAQPPSSSSILRSTNSEQKRADGFRNGFLVGRLEPFIAVDPSLFEAIDVMQTLLDA
jgi:hypothetical protein